MCCVDAFLCSLGCARCNFFNFFNFGLFEIPTLFAAPCHDRGGLNPQVLPHQHLSLCGCLCTILLRRSEFCLDLFLCLPGRFNELQNMCPRPCAQFQQLFGLSFVAQRAKIRLALAKSMASWHLGHDLAISLGSVVIVLSWMHGSCAS